MMRQLINQKINTLTATELARLSGRYGLNVSHKQSESIVKVIKRRRIDIFEEDQRKSLLRRIAKTTEPKLAKDMEQLFSRFMKK